MLCTLCENLAPKLVFPPCICGDCWESLLSQRLNCTENFGSSNVRALFRYDFGIREMIMRAKVRNDPVASGFLFRLIQSLFNDSLVQFNCPETLIIPAPPSLWGRLRGKLDLAQMACVALFPHADIFLGVLPGTFFRRKRAGRNEDLPSYYSLHANVLEYFINSMNGHDLLGKISRSKRILLVDDVMTTGLTMRTIFNQLIELGAQSVDGLVIASSAHYDDEPDSAQLNS